MYASIKFTLGDIHQAVQAENTIHTNEKDALMARWRYPCLSLHGVEGAFYSPGAKTVIPAKVIGISCSLLLVNPVLDTGKFSIRSVPNMLPEKISELVIDHVNKTFAKLGSKNKAECTTGHGGKAWLSDVNHFNYRAAGMCACRHHLTHTYRTRDRTRVRRKA